MNNLFQIATWSILIYALVVLLGGVMGYLKAKSQVSLLSGVGSGIALLVAWFICRQTPQVGLGLAALIGLMLFVVFIMRFFRTRAFMPAGLMMVFSLAATVVFILGLLTNTGFFMTSFSKPHYMQPQINLVLAHSWAYPSVEVSKSSALSTSSRTSG